MQLDDMQIDALGEIGNIGAGHAATAISEFIKQQVNISIPTVRVLSIKALSLLGLDPKQTVDMVSAKVAGELSGALIFTLPDSAMLLLQDLYEKAEVKAALDAPEGQFFKQLGQLVLESHLKAMLEFTQIESTIESTELVTGKWVSVIDKIFTSSKELLLLDIKFNIAGTKCEGYIFMALTEKSGDDLLQALLGT